MNASKSGLSALVLAATAAVAVGCASKSNHKAPDPRPLTPEAFIQPRAGSSVSEGGTATGSGGEVGAGEAARPAITIPLGKKPVPTTTPSTPTGPRSDATGVQSLGDGRYQAVAYKVREGGGSALVVHPRG